MPNVHDLSVGSLYGQGREDSGLPDKFDATCKPREGCW